MSYFLILPLGMALVGPWVVSDVVRSINWNLATKEMWVKQLVKGAISAVFLCTQRDSTLDFEEKICSSKWRSKYARKARIYWLVVWNINLIVHFIYGVSSFPLTKSIIFQDGEIAPATSISL